LNSQNKCKILKKVGKAVKIPVEEKTATLACRQAGIHRFLFYKNKLICESVALKSLFNKNRNCFLHFF
jgi:hypothetical protein